MEDEAARGILGLEPACIVLVLHHAQYPGWNARFLWYRVGNNNILYDTLFLIIPFSDDFCSIAFGVFSSPHWWKGWRMERLKPGGFILFFFVWGCFDFFLCGVNL